MMVSSTFQNLQCCKKSKDNLKDGISELPDNILGHILSLNPTIDVIRTSVLSKRWRNVWTSVLTFDINDRRTDKKGSSIDVEAQFMNFVDKVLFGLNEASLRIFRVKLYENHDLSHVRKWINMVTKLKDLEEFELVYYASSHFELPPCVLTLKKLVSLTLTVNVRISFPSSSVFLPSLETLELHWIPSLDTDCLNTLLNGCPRLDVFTLSCRTRVDEMGDTTLYVKSSTMRRFKLVAGDGRNYHGNHLSRIVIDANNLEEFDLNAQLRVHIDSSTKPSSLVKVELHIYDSDGSVTNENGEARNNLLDLLGMISNTKYMSLTLCTMECLERGLCHQLPLFNNLMHLEGDIDESKVTILPYLLESSPNLVLVSLSKSGKSRYWSTLPSPNCLMQHLEKLQLELFILRQDEIDMVAYFLKIAPILKTVSITIGSSIMKSVVSDFESKIFKLPKASHAFKIEITLRGWISGLVRRF